MTQAKRRRVWVRDKALKELACRPLYGFGSVGDAIEALVWTTSYRTCQSLERKLTDTIDLLTAEEDSTAVRLWLAIITDRLRYGDRL